MVPESKGVWTEASACVLCQPSVAVQVFQVECGYMHSPKIIGKLQSWRYHGNNLPGTHKSRARRIKGRVTSVVWKILSRVEDLCKSSASRRDNILKSIYELVKHTCFTSLIYAQWKARAEQKEQASNAENMQVQ